MARGLKALWSLSMVLLVSNWQHWARGKAERQVPCYFVFGDSLFDNGNNNYLTTPVKVNYLPYGIDFPTGASGRCSNGLNIADTIAEQLGFDSFITDFGVGSCTSYLDGVNYGSSGAGILDETGSLSGELFTMNIQLYNHKITVSRIAKHYGSDEAKAKKHLGQCIYAIDMGHNDYLNNYFLDTYSSSKIYTNPETYAQHLIETYKTQLEDLYSTGARKIAVFGLIRVGCMPYNIQQHPNELDKENSCVDKLNKAVQFFNTKLEKLIKELNTKHAPDAAFTYINSYKIDSETNNGFKFTRESCCNVIQSGSVTCKSLSIPCANRNEYVYWDGAHFTEAKARAVGERAYKRGSPEDASPYDISELVQLKLPEKDVNIVNHAEL